MYKKDAAQFWKRYNGLVGKDLPVTISTGIKQSTLSSWKNRQVYPRADQAYLIAKSIGTTVQYLVTGQDEAGVFYSKAAMELAKIAGTLSDNGIVMLKEIAFKLMDIYPIMGSKTSGSLES